MTPEQAAGAIAVFRPRFVYPFHYKGTDPGALKSLVTKESGTEVVIRNWYARH